MEHISAPVSRVLQSVIDKMTDAAASPFSSPPPPRAVPASSEASTMDTHRKVKPPSELAIATHESGHAVARLALREIFNIPGPYIRSISIVPTDGHLGLVEMDPRFWMNCADVMPATPEVLRNVRLDIIETLAGHLAEVRRRKGSWFSGRMQQEAGVAAILAIDPEGQEDGDFAFSAARLRWLMRHTAGSPEDVLGRLWLAAWLLVEVEWTAIDRLSRVMVTAGELDGERLLDVWSLVKATPARRAKRLEQAGEHSVKVLHWAVGLEAAA
jgi:hypothetical protein